MSGIEFTPRVWAAAGVVATAAAVSPASAATITAAVSTTSTSVTVALPSERLIGSRAPTSASAPSSSVQVDQFDSSLGTLTGVTLNFDGAPFSLTGADRGELEADRALCTGTNENGRCDYAYSIGYNVSGTVLAPLSSLIEQTGRVEGSGSSSEQVDDVVRTTAAGDSDRFGSGFVSAPSSSGPHSLGSPAFAPYIGASTWDLFFDLELTNIALSSLCTSNAAATCDTDNQGGIFETSDGEGVRWDIENISVTYTFDAAPATDTPEPASLSVLALGLGALAMAGRRRRRQQAA